MATDKLIVMKLTVAVGKKKENWNLDHYLKLQGHYILVAFRCSAWRMQ